MKNWHEIHLRIISWIVSGYRNIWIYFAFVLYSEQVFVGQLGTSFVWYITRWRRTLHLYVPSETCFITCSHRCWKKLWTWTASTTSYECFVFAQNMFKWVIQTIQIFVIIDFTNWFWSGSFDWFINKYILYFIIWNIETITCGIIRFKKLIRTFREDL